MKEQEKGLRLVKTLAGIDEDILVQRAQQGDRNAFGELMRHYHPAVHAVVYRLCGEADLAEDATQDAFIKAWLRLPQFREGSSLYNWLCRIAVNAWLDALRHEKRERVDGDLLPAVEDPAPGPETRLVESEQSAAIQRALLSLPEHCRAAIVLRENAGLSYQEIASTLDIPLGTVMSRLNYGRNQLRILLKPYLAK